MVRLQLRRMPGQANPPRYRAYFDTRSDTRGIEWFVTGSMSDLQAFLQTKLDVPQSTAARLAIECESSGSSYTELALLDEPEIKILMRGWASEQQKLVEQGKTILPAQATQ